MNPECRSFRTALSEALCPTAQGERRELGWHRHLLTCNECRDLLAAEEVLDELLASLPIPRLRPDLAKRVLARLEHDRVLARLEHVREHQAVLDDAGDDRFNELLAVEGEPDVPSGLAQRVLAGVSEARAQQSRDAAAAGLDLLLDRLPEPEVPAGLEARVLAGVAPHRRTGRLLRFPGRLGAVTALAAAVLLAALVWLAFDVFEGRGAPTVNPRESGPDIVDTSDNVDPELLAALDVLENWDAVTSDDLDLLLDDLDALDFMLIEHGSGVSDEEEEG